MSIYLMKGVLWLLCCAEVLMCFCMLDIFLNIKEQLNKKKMVAIAVCVLGMGSLLAINRQLLFFSKNMWILCMVIVSTYAIGIIRKNALIVVEVVVISLSVISLLDILLLFLIDGVSVIEVWNDVYFRTSSSWGVLVFAITRGLVFAAMRIAKKGFVKEIDKQLLRIIMAPIAIAISILVCFFHVLFVCIVKDGAELSEWLVGGSILCVLVLFLYITTFCAKSMSLRKENSILAIREATQEKQYRTLQRQSEENKRMVHDFKNHILALQGLSKAGDMHAVLSYLQNLNEVFYEYEEKQWCDNAVINSIINQKLHLAKDANVTCRVKITPLTNILLGESELVTVFGNLLDNSIEACQKVVDKERWIELEMKQKQGIFHIKIVNSLQNRPEIENNKIRTTKADKMSHGYGLKNVSRIVEKYHGVMSLEATDEVFEVNISFFFCT